MSYKMDDLESMFDGRSEGKGTWCLIPLQALHVCFVPPVSGARPSLHENARRCDALAISRSREWNPCCEVSRRAPIFCASAISAITLYPMANEKCA